MQVKTVPIAKNLFHRHILRQISRHIHIQSLIHSHIVSKQLQRNHAQQRNQRIQGSWNLQYIIRYFLHLQVTLCHHGKDAAVSRLHLLHVRDNLFIQLMMRSKENNWHILIYQSDRTMLHFGSRITLGMDVTDFLQLQGTLHRHRIVHTTTQIQEVVRISKHSGDILDYRSLLQYLLHFLRNLRKFLYHLIIVSKEATIHTILQTVRLVINLLQHKVIKTTLAQLADVQIHGLDIVMTGRMLQVDDVQFLVHSDVGNLTILQIHHLIRMLHDRSRITGDTLRTQPRHR